MAKLSKEEPIYQVTNLFRTRCLVQGNSLIWPDRPAWTIDNLSALWEAFIGHHDTSDLHFFEKWRK